jgi:hypothetical protein
LPLHHRFGKAVGADTPTAPKRSLPHEPKLGVSGIVRVKLRKQSQFERRITRESIAGPLVFNRSQKGNLRPPWPCEQRGTPSVAVSSPQLGGLGGHRWLGNDIRPPEAKHLLPLHSTTY